MISGNGNNVGPFGDTALTKVFVGGLAWETPNDALRDHFESYGEILEAVIISDKTTGRSKGYGFVTFKEPESAKKACEDPSPVINGRRANCNLASLGARRQRSTFVAPPLQNGPNNVNVGPRSAGTVTPPLPPLQPPRSHVQWYYPHTPAAYIHRNHHQTTVPYYGYGPATYVGGTNVGYNNKIGYMSGAYITGGAHTQVYPGQAMVGAGAFVAMYPLHHYNQAAVGSYSGPGPRPAVPIILSKPKNISPTPGTISIFI
ncbi:hypothetical protein OSB04_017528 [Centaurea solstitialis]|uniref:RRM domain-containing protein n=1 Tax=Centaurea solstitialis TaxID=347529 RepID=A0AA38T324_9ASTR|nr:hypothetical protein OSB04_017528 [Centaurea solstitialis]